MAASTLLKIGDIAKLTGVSVGTLRYYETLKLLHPIKRGQNGYRYYSLEIVQQVQFIKQSQALGFSLEEIRQLLEVCDRGEPPCSLVQTLLDEKINQLGVQVQQMMAFKLELEGYRDRWANVPKARTDDKEICPLIATVALPSDWDR
ncbi:MAG: heavy metal-responsive transcriptional regulator [Leptolyngbya sp. RL_3_1]|nr:heavy metal-responsive transcriptional regulator [Leptolyngbya sp. RL_3_1]